jgi:hypothetical protein
MIRMELDMKNIQDIKNICRDSQAAKISQIDEDKYAKLCHQNLPIGINQTCENKNSTFI